MGRAEKHISGGSRLSLCWGASRLAVVMVALLLLPGCSLMMAENPQAWTPAQPTTCSTSPAAPVVDVGVGVVLASVAGPLGVPHIISALWGLAKMGGCASSKTKREKWLAQRDSDEERFADEAEQAMAERIARARAAAREDVAERRVGRVRGRVADDPLGDEDETDDPLGDEDETDDPLGDEDEAGVEAGDEDEAASDEAEVNDCDALVTGWRRERDPRRNAELYGRLPGECQTIAAGIRVGDAKRWQREQSLAAARRRAAATGAIAKRAAAVRAVSDRHSTDAEAHAAAVAERAWHAMTVAERRAWTKLLPAERRAAKRRMVAAYVERERERETGAELARLEHEGWALLSAEERAAWAGASALERSNIKRRALAAARAAEVDRRRRREAGEIERAHRAALSEAEAKAWQELSEEERRTGELTEYLVDAEAEAARAKRERAEQEWRQVAAAAAKQRAAELAQQGAEADKRRQAEEDQRRVAEAANEKRRMAEREAKRRKDEADWIAAAEAEERRRLEAAEERNADQAEAARVAAARQRRIEAEKRRQAEEDKRRQAEEDKRRQAEEDKRRQAEEDERRQAEEDKRRGAGRPAKPGELGGYCRGGDECNGDLVCDVETTRCVRGDADTESAEEIKKPTLGYFICNTKPIARVWIDNKDTGKSTPIPAKSQIELAPGKHHVTFVVAGQMFTYRFTVAAGKTTKLIKLLKVDK